MLKFTVFLFVVIFASIGKKITNANVTGTNVVINPCNELSNDIEITAGLDNNGTDLCGALKVEPGVSISENSLQIAQNIALAQIDSTILSIREKAVSTPDISEQRNQKSEQVEKQGREFARKVLDGVRKVSLNGNSPDVQHMQEQVNNRIKNIKIEDAGVVGSIVCSAIPNQLDTIAHFLIKNTLLCSLKKLWVDTESNYIKNMFEDARMNLIQVREKVQHCGDNVGSVNSNDEAILCITEATHTVIQDSNKFIEDVDHNISKHFDAYAQHSLRKCSVRNGLRRFKRKLSTVVKDTQQCRKQWYASVVKIFY